MDKTEKIPARERTLHNGQGSAVTRRQVLVRGAWLPLATVSATALLTGAAAAQNSSNDETSDTGESGMALETGKTALVLLHYQDDIINIFSQAGIGDYVTRMTDLAAQVRAAGVPVIFVKIGFSEDYREVSPNNQNGQMIKSFGLFTGDGIPDGLKHSEDVVLTGHRVSGFKGTSLDMELRSMGIDTLIMGGVTTTGVVVSTVAEASDLDYRILLVEDGCFEPDQAAHDGLFRTAFATRAEITSANAVAAML